MGFEDRAALDAAAGEAGRLFRKGDMASAMRLFGRIAQEDPSHRAAHLAIAAALCADGKVAEGRFILKSHFARCPLDAPPPEEGAERLLLRLRGCDRVEIGVSRSLRHGRLPRLRGGHLTTGGLLHAPSFPIRTFTIAEGNILTPGAAPPHAALLNTIADPDVEAASLDALEAYLATPGRAPVINRPERVRETTRDGNWRRFKDIPGLAFPRTRRFEVAEASLPAWGRAVAALDVQAPVILRRAGAHGGRDAALIASDDELAAFATEMGTGAFYAIDFHKLKFGAGHYRMMRLFYIDGAYHPALCQFDTEWSVRAAAPREAMGVKPSLVEEEKRFMADWRTYVGARAADGLDRAAAAAGLDFFGVEFDVNAAGDAVIFELNAVMRHVSEHEAAYPYLAPYGAAIAAAFTKMTTARVAG